jgi:RNA polymerase sigma factor for flagellar operon FliA
MVDLIRRYVPLSRGAAERRRQLREKEAALRLELGREPIAGELASALGRDAGGLAALRSATVPLRFESIDEVYSD